MIYYDNIESRGCTSKHTLLLFSRRFFLFEKNLYYFFTHIPAISQSLSGRVINLALLYAICKVKIVRPT